MKTIPDVMKNHPYKYNIINRLLLLQGGVGTLNEKKKELIDYLKERGARPATIRSWLVIERGVKHEIPTSALTLIGTFFNKKYEQQFERNQQSGLRSRSEIFEPILITDLFCEGQLKILPER